MIVYKHTNRITGKSYVGWTKHPIEVRWKHHVNNALASSNNWKFWNAIRKYGIDCWDHKILSIHRTSKKAMEKEKYFIKKFDTYNSGYNSTLGGHGFTGKHTQETKIKCGLATRGIIWSKESNLKRSITMKEVHKIRIYPQNYVAISPDGKKYNVNNLTKFCKEQNLKKENLRWTLKTGLPCPYVHKGWILQYGI